MNGLSFILNYSDFATPVVTLVTEKSTANTPWVATLSEQLVYLFTVQPKLTLLICEGNLNPGRE